MDLFAQEFDALPACCQDEGDYCVSQMIPFLSNTFKCEYVDMRKFQCS